MPKPSRISLSVAGTIFSLLYQSARQCCPARDEPFPVERLVTQPLRLIQPVGGEEDGDAAVTQPRYSPGDSGMIEIRWRISPALASPTGTPATAAPPAVAEISVPKNPHRRGLARRSSANSVRLLRGDSELAG